MIKKLYKKSEIGFAAIWVILYTILVSVGESLSISIGVSKIISLPMLLALTIILYDFIKKNGLSEKYGLCRPQLSASKMLFYTPLIILLTANFWYGIAVTVSPLEILLHILSMFCVGFLEEIIYRGFLFNAMVKDGVKSAIFISNVVFGVGHMVPGNFQLSFVQVMYAIAIGFAFSMVYYKTKSLLPCIITHCLFNSAGVFFNDAEVTVQIQIAIYALIIIISVSYALYIALMVKNEEAI